MNRKHTFTGLLMAVRYALKEIRDPALAEPVDWVNEMARCLRT